MIPLPRMKPRLLLALLLASPLVAAAQQPPTEKSAPASHPLKGVVVEVRKDRSALLVKHEEVPGVMRAMTMLLKVEPKALEAVKAGDAITAQLSRRDDGWWLHDVKVVSAPAPK
jgi:Cu/Ag efflux protein CusF